MFYNWQGEDLILNCRIQPKASADCFDGVDNDRLRVRIKAPPVDGKANQHLIKFLSRQFRTPQQGVTLESGHNGRNKRVRISNPRQLPPELDIQNTT